MGRIAREGMRICEGWGLEEMGERVGLETGRRIAASFAAERPRAG